ncbi:hypothetical protein Pyn_28163 [Prunus yedoensis var. nudiflora]|uniref:Uncharacterized protein n=1 Tax=Prunus yedoensis var. nudiflora TaxID=2094558 RepID=A0A314ZDS7_PRUYE|nr:hypothetical protein Pyn_28163 [Prunus yedoensis var. nudiflora]
MVEEPLREAVIGVLDRYDLVLVTDGLDNEVSGRWESENGCLSEKGSEPMGCRLCILIEDMW